MSKPCNCGCCAGVEVVTPVALFNAPGQPELRYRVGTHATFYESMLARLATLAIDVPSESGTSTDHLHPLAKLTTRDPSDPAIALLDAWALVADVLTFYQERIANEGYLPTAIERRSILELARLVGYRLRPGVAASVYLAFTVADAFNGELPAGTRAQSIPGANESPQFFETSDILAARDVWNAIKPRLTRPTAVSPAKTGVVTDADVLDTFYLSGIATNLNAGDFFLIVLGDGAGLQTMRRLEAVDAQADDKRTELIFLPTPPQNSATLYAKKAAELFPGSVLAAEVEKILADFLEEAGKTDGIAVSAADAVAALREKQALAESRNFTRLGPFIRHAAQSLPAPADSQPTKFPPLLPLAGLFALQTALARPVSAQLASAAFLGKSVAQSFSPLSDIAPRVIGTLKPTAAPYIYRAWTRVVKAPDRLEAHALRVRANLFASSYPGPATVTTSGGKSTTSFTPPAGIFAAWDSLFPLGDIPVPPLAIALDAVYDKIKPGSWIVVERPGLDFSNNGLPNGKPEITYHKVKDVRAGVVDTGTGFTAKVTLLVVDPLWLSDLSTNDFKTARASKPILRETIVYAQSEQLAMAEEPLDADVSGDSVDLPGVYDGLEPGRWMIVSGERTDVPGVSGVKASELVMLAGVSQGTDVTFSKKEVSADLGKLHTQLHFDRPLAYTYEAKSVTVYGNVAKATHGQTVGEVLGDGDATKVFATFALRQSPLTYVSAPTPSGIESTLTVRVNDIRWHELNDLAGAGARDRVYVTRTDDAGKTAVTFGNGWRGARVPTGTANLKAVYRYGMGKTGNVRAEQISQLATHPLGAQGVINPLRASGGANADSADQARRNTPLAVMALDRLVSVRDYADFARTFAGIGKASAARLSDGRRTLVHLTVAGNDDIPIDRDSDLYRNLLASLEEFGDPHLPIALCPRRTKLLVISAGVAIDPDYDWEVVEPKVRAAMLIHFGFDVRDLGQTAFLSEAIAVMQGIEGVVHVDVDVFGSIAEDITAEQLVQLGQTLGLNQYVLAEMARHASGAVTSDDPCQQVLPAELVFMTPDIPETLILNKVGA